MSSPSHRPLGFPCHLSRHALQHNNPSASCSHGLHDRGPRPVLVDKTAPNGRGTRTSPWALLEGRQTASSYHSVSTGSGLGRGREGQRGWSCSGSNEPKPSGSCQQSHQGSALATPETPQLAPPPQQMALCSEGLRKYRRFCAEVSPPWRILWPQGVPPLWAARSVSTPPVISGTVAFPECLLAPSSWQPPTKFQLGIAKFPSQLLIMAFVPRGACNNFSAPHRVSLYIWTHDAYMLSYMYFSGQKDLIETKVNTSVKQSLTRSVVLEVWFPNQQHGRPRGLLSNANCRPDLLGQNPREVESGRLGLTSIQVTGIRCWRSSAHRRLPQAHTRPMFPPNTHLEGEVLAAVSA